MFASQIRILSTEFSMERAEIVTVDYWQGTTCSLEAGTELLYMHSGIVDSGVDMRGEVVYIIMNYDINFRSLPSGGLLWHI